VNANGELALDPPFETGDERFRKVMPMAGSALLEGSGVLNSSYIKHHFYYSCRTTPYIWPDAQQVATSVAIYDLEQVSYTGTPYDAQPMLTSSDAEYVQSVCGTAQH
jgi:hypothetical protein